MEEAKQWISWDPNPKTRAIVEKALESPKDIEAMFNGRISFGTAGLRAEMTAGPKMMNDLVIIQTAQGFCQYLFDNLGETTCKGQGIVLGFDHRLNKDLDLSSKTFALYTALCFLKKGVKVYFFNEIVATPFVAYAITYFNAVAGVMVTASHNPKKDNGFKVYWGNGCQIIPPHDKGIATAIMNNLEPLLELSEFNPTMEYLEKLFSSLFCSITPDEADVLKEYFKNSKQLLNRNEDGNKTSTLKVMYTAMHGVGAQFFTQSVLQFGFRADNIYYVESQRYPDPSFPTVSFPNPEEKNALDIAMEEASKNGCTLILANDPDADRLAVAALGSDKKWKVFSGNEIGAMLAIWQIQNYKKAPVASKKPKAAVVVSTVSSKQVGKICEVEGIEYYETLTGFKWLGNKCVELRASADTQVLLAYEEAIGFCVGDLVCDKDGVTAAAVFYEFAASIGSTNLVDYMEGINKKYGYFVANNGYIMILDEGKKEQKMASLEEIKLGETFGKEKKYEVTKVKDLFPNSGMVMLEVNGVINLTLRLSGTEPKLKYYTEISGDNVESLSSQLDAFVEDGLKNDILIL